MSSLVREQRRVLADVLAEAGPDQPTLCEGWTTRDLAAHVVVRDRRVDAQPGIVLPGLSRWTGRVTRSTSKNTDYEELVRKVRAGAPPWLPMGFPPTDELLNLLEVYVHTEDVRRAAAGWAPRSLPPEVEEALWRRLRAAAAALFRRATVGVRLQRADAEASHVARGGEPWVTLLGKPSELVLYAYGRKRHAQVRLLGDPETVERFASTPLDV